jgi:hypothetical protein
MGQGDDDDEIVFVKTGSVARLSPHQVKSEPYDPADPALPTVTADAGTPIIVDDSGTNVLIPKKKKKIIKRSASEAAEDARPPPPPIVTIRLSHDLVLDGETLEWDVLQSASELGLVMRRQGIEAEPAMGMGEGEPLAIPLEEAGGPSRIGSPVGLTAEEKLAKELDERWNAGAVKKKVRSAPG